MALNESAGRGGTQEDGLTGAVELIGDRWKLLILSRALHGATRFSQFLDIGIARKSLSRRLKCLVESGLLSRESRGARDVSYRLTDAGRALAPVFDELTRWAADVNPGALREG